MGYPRWLLFSLFIKHECALKCGVAWFIMDKLNKSFISWILSRIVSSWLCASCQHPSRLSISHEPASSWNIPFKYMLSPVFLETILSSRHASHSLQYKAHRCKLNVFLNGFLLSCRIRLRREMYWPHQWCLIYHLYSYSEVRLWASKQMVSQSVLMVCILLMFIQMHSHDNICQES